MNLINVKTVMGLFILSMLCLFIACESEVMEDQITAVEKEEVVKSEPGEEGESFYFLDNEEVPEGTYEPGDEAFYFIAFKGSEDDAKDPNVYNYAFTTVDLYLQFSEQYKLGLDRLLNFTEDMASVNEAFDVENYYQEKESMPKGYEASVDEVYAKYFGDGEASANQEKVLTFIHQNCPAFGNNFWMAYRMPLMWPGWNNNVSAFRFLAIHGFIANWDRRFFIGRPGVFFNWGLNRMCFQGDWDNSMSSGITFSR